jgi:LmbE family N-acetylglucosaminyl deacetylase
MKQLSLGLGSQTPDQILVIGAHSDDIEIGCGGTILRLVREYPASTIHWAVLSATGEREKEARQSAAQFLTGAAHANVQCWGFRDGFFPYTGGDIKDVFEQLKKALTPDVIFTHYHADAHQDHRIVNELTWNTWRDHLICEYEIPKYDGDFGNPNLFVEVDDELARRKVAILQSSFVTQRTKRWFTDDTFLGLMRIRAVQAGVQSRYVEAFYVRKAVARF